MRDSGKRTFHGRQDLTATRIAGTNDVGFVCRKFGKLIVPAAMRILKPGERGVKPPLSLFLSSAFLSSLHNQTEA